MHRTVRRALSVSVSLMGLSVGACDRATPTAPAPATQPAGAQAAMQPIGSRALAIAPLPEPTDLRLAGTYRTLTALADFVEAVTAYRTTPTDATRAAALTRATTLRKLRDAAHFSDTGVLSIDGFQLLYARSSVYMFELQTQSQLMQQDDLPRYQAFRADLMKANPDILAFISVNNAFGPDASVSRVTSMQQTLRSQLELYALQHTNRADLSRGWTQLTQKTDEDGRLNPNGRYGPYLQTEPRNALTGGSKITLVNDVRLAVGGHQGCDYVYQVPTGKFWAIDADGKLLNEAADIVADAQPASAQRPMRKLVLPVPRH